MCEIIWGKTLQHFSISCILLYIVITVYSAKTQSRNVENETTLRFRVTHMDVGKSKRLSKTIIARRSSFPMHVTSH